NSEGKLALAFFELTFQCRVDPIHVGPGLIDRHSSLKPSNQLDEMIVATVHYVVGWKRDWRPQVNLRHVVKERHAFRHDAADQARSSIDVYLAADNVGVAAELPLPQAITQ